VPNAIWLIPLRLVALVSLGPLTVMALVLTIPAFLLDIVLAPWEPEDGTCTALTMVWRPMMTLSDWLRDG
jgi:hypothetical protein